MRATVNKDDLFFAAGTAGRAQTSKTATSPQGVRLTAEDGTLFLTSIDNEIAITCRIAAQVLEPGAIVLPGKLLAEAVRRFPGLDIDLEVLLGRHTMTLRSGFSELDLLGMPATNFPELPEIESLSTFSLPEHVLGAMLRQTSFALSSDDMRPILTGMLWHFSTGILRIVAADGFKVASRIEQVEDTGAAPFRVVVPGRTIHELERLLGHGDEPVEIAVGRNHILFQVKGTVLISRLLEGNYIDVDRFVPTTFVTHLSVKPKTLIDALERSAVVAKDGLIATVRLHLRDGRLSVRAQSAEYGKHFEEWPVEMRGEEMDILFNIRVLGEVVRSITEGDIELSFTGQHGPCIARSAVSPENYWSLVMPVRLS